ncbi:DNA-binding protein [Neobacillus niacini]|uniref:DNA-binding protein n=1 Tax=Neobacillus niacini TaxID=86668 RepID=UPI0021CB407D|nr:DNA-binding protein [Neobacillus niacini]MCM3765187.1 DNA-binding protein [Neobacillus niacini]
METKSNLPESLSKPAKRALQGAGYVRLEQLTKVREAEIMQLHGMGPKALELLKKSLAEMGLSFDKNS